ncbi:MAG: type I glyceraldehyde-3-phosphate dehydrogenase [bacterium]
MARVAINGLGRIGRAAFKVTLENPELELVAINDTIPIEDIIYLLKYDSVYGRYGKEVKGETGTLMVEGKKYKAFSEKDPANLPWSDLKVDIVFECSGIFTKKEDLEKHLQAGAKHVILSATSKSDDILTVVFGTNKPKGDPKIISCASCTTNCITPVIEVIGRRIGLKKSIMTTFHAYTSSQNLVDGPNKKIRRGRAGAINFVPTSTSAAIATTRVLPEYKDRFDGISVRGPLATGSLADINLLIKRPTTVEEINQIFKEETKSERYKNILGVAEDPIVSSDIIQDSHASVVDLEATQVVDGDLVKVMSWYDNEWGYVNQMIRTGAYLAKES